MKSKKYRLLVHYRLPQIREGFEDTLSALSVSVYYTRLDEEGILFKLGFDPHLIVILMGEGDSDYDLSFKIKLFAPHIPLMVITPQIPDSYKQYLLQNGVEKVIQLPMNKEDICQSITNLLVQSART